MNQRLLAVVLLGFAGCGEESGVVESGTPPAAEALAGSCVGPEDLGGSCFVCTGTSCDLEFEIGYQGVEPVRFFLRTGEGELAYESAPARLWYVFQPAAQAPEDKPLAVFFNGGPGASTSSLLFAFNTAGWTFDPHATGGNAVVANPHPWTEIANLLYIDARNAGFSYSLMDDGDPDDPLARHEQFSGRNHNAFVDGADFVRVLLRFLQRHPTLTDNPVMLVGESYGGIRSTVVLHLLYNYKEYADEELPYQDEELSREIRDHYYAIFPDLEGEHVPKERIAEQFSRQVLIQPLLSGSEEGPAKGALWEQSGSVMYDIAYATGTTFVPCSAQPPEPPCHPVVNGLSFVTDIAQRDVYHWDQPVDWTTAQAEIASENLVKGDNLRIATGINVGDLRWMGVDARRNAYRIGDPKQLQSAIGVVMQNGDLPDWLGKLEEWDGYHVFFNDYIYRAFQDENVFRLGLYHGFSTRFVQMFLENVIWVDTFLTNAEFDLKVYSPVQPGVLAGHTEYLYQLHDTGDWLELEYLPEYDRGCMRAIRFPAYSAGHAVTASVPRQLRDDVATWVDDGLLCPP